MLSYRPDIDGLRAVAVVPVILCHAGVPGFAGGYVGVDVFFVISGYLISGIILADIDADRFSLMYFYERRVRRILPMLLTVVGLSLAAGYAVMLPHQFADLSSGALSVTVFASNVYFWLTQDYFSEVAGLNPLLQTWSLAVEEQYYLLFPLALIFVAKMNPRWIIAAVCVVAILSFALGQAGGNLSVHPPYIEQEVRMFSQPAWASFYLPTGRVYEFLLGTLAVMVTQRGVVIPQGVRQVGSAAGLALILGAVGTFEETLPYPSLYTLVPVAGAGLILMLAGPTTVVGRVLAWRLPVGLGLISYSLYLWHQPLFAFARLLSDVPLGLYDYAGLTIAACVLSVISWRYVEMPFRRCGGLSRRQVFVAMGLATLVVMAVSTAGITTKGFIARYPVGDHELVGRSPKSWGEYVVRRFDALKQPAFAAEDGRPRLLVIGDSYAQDFINMAAETGWLNRFSVRTFYIPEKCQPYLGDEDVEVFIQDNFRTFCRKAPGLSEAVALVNEADIVVLSSLWHEWAAERLAGTIARMGLHPSQKLVVLGSTYFGPINFNRLMRMPLADRASLRVRSPLPVNDLLRNRLAGIARFVDAQDLICGADDRCRMFTPDNSLIAFDAGHLTAAGAAYVGHLVFGHPAFSDLGKQ